MSVKSNAIMNISSVEAAVKTVENSLGAGSTIQDGSLVQGRIDGGETRQINNHKPAGGAPNGVNDHRPAHDVRVVQPADGQAEQLVDGSRIGGKNHPNGQHRSHDRDDLRHKQNGLKHFADFPDAFGLKQHRKQKRKAHGGNQMHQEIKHGIADGFPEGRIIEQGAVILQPYKGGLSVALIFEKAQNERISGGKNKENDKRNQKRRNEQVGDHVFMALGTGNFTGKTLLHDGTPRFCLLNGQWSFGDSARR